MTADRKFKPGDRVVVPGKRSGWYYEATVVAHPIGSPSDEAFHRPEWVPVVVDGSDVVRHVRAEMCKPLVDEGEVSS